MPFPLALLAAGVLAPLVASTVLSLGLLASAATRTQSTTPAARPRRRFDDLHTKPTPPILNDISLDLSRLHGELKLDVSQDTLWCKAEKADWCDMSHVQDCLQQQRAEMLVRLAQPGADLRAIARCFDDFVAEGQKRCAANRERWLNVYDALDAAQKEQVRVFFKNRMELANPRGR